MAPTTRVIPHRQTRRVGRAVYPQKVKSPWNVPGLGGEIRTEWVPSARC